MAILLVVLQGFFYCLDLACQLRVLGFVIPHGCHEKALLDGFKMMLILYLTLIAGIIYFKFFERCCYVFL